MKYFKYITMRMLLSITWILLLGSCSKELDLVPLDSITDAAVWSDKILTQSFLNDLTNSTAELYTVARTDAWTDNCVLYEENEASEEYRVQYSEITQENFDAGWNKFSMIRKCNLFLQQIETEQTAALFEDLERKDMIAQAKTLRGMIYFWLARRFGGHIILDRVLDPEEDLKLPRNTEKEVYDFILTDLEAAMPDLIESTSDKFRITKGAALAMITMVGIQYPNDDTYYDKAISAGLELETLGYSLEPNYEDLFNTFSGVTSSESIFSWARAEPQGIVMGDTRMGKTINNIGWERQAGLPPFPEGFGYIAFATHFPSQELVDSYMFKNGGNPVQRKGIEFEGQDSANMWMDRDDRFEPSIQHDSSNIYGAIFNMKEGGNQARGLSGIGNGTYSGYFFNKWLYESVTRSVLAWSPPIDWGEPILRLGEVYLNISEAYARKNNLDKAVEYLNKTRTTHGGLAELPVTNLTDYWKFYKIERRVELAYEDDRYWSLIRWSRADGNVPIPELNTYLTFINLYQHTDGLVRIQSTAGNVYRAPLKFEVPKRYFFPVPISEIQNNEKLKQNPDWQN